MKNLKYIAMGLLASLALLTWSCGGSDSDDPEPTPTPPQPTTKGRHLTKTHDMTAKSEAATISLSGLSAEVSRNTGSASWLTVTVKPYTSGTPEVELKVTENSEKTSRQQDITFYAAKDTLVLTVRQAAFNANGGTDTESPFGTPSSQPGYARQW